MGNWISSETGAIPEERLSLLQHETGFTSIQIEKLWDRFTILDKEGKGYLTRDDLSEIPELKINPVSKQARPSKIV